MCLGIVFLVANAKYASFRARGRVWKRDIISPTDDFPGVSCSSVQRQLRFLVVAETFSWLGFC